MSATAQLPERHSFYKWVALSNTTLGVLMASINGSILIIALPAIFRGIQVNPLNSGQTSLLLWVLLGFNVATTVLLVSFGRISDAFGRVRLYNLGFLIFTIGSILLYFTPGKGIAGEWELIIFRFVQGIGGAFLFSNSAAIITDAFPSTQRGFALGINQIAAIGGSVIGLVLGGLLAAIDWRAIFLVSVPIGVIGTVWAYIALREQAKKREAKSLDIWGNLTFGVGLLAILTGLTYGIMPYGHQPMGWSDPLIIAALAGGAALLLAFVFIERVVPDPMFRMSLFRNRAFTLGNISGFLAAVARGGLSFMLIIWLQGIWLPLHGVSFTDTPLQAGIDTIPQMVGFLIAGPVSGWLSDRFGARWFGFIGMFVTAAGFLLLNTLPADFVYWQFALYIFIIGAGMGLFSSPNTTSIMNAVPTRDRGVASGMRATFQNGGNMMSMGIFFTFVIGSLAGNLPQAMTAGLTKFALPATSISTIAHLPPTSALFAALLGYNPMASLVKPSVLAQLPQTQSATLVGRAFFPGLISSPFMTALHIVFWFSLAVSLIAAFASLLRGKRYVFEEAEPGLAEDEPEEGSQDPAASGRTRATHGR